MTPQRKKKIKLKTSSFYKCENYEKQNKMEDAKDSKDLPRLNMDMKVSGESMS